ncbi:hypothetical protein LRH25_00180 [Ideonella azotifigens]|uniref:Uncharacterized protein n=2 Tax=Ideonella azotifigens TaxID=513160 RepID=A0ABN1KAV4_9BURK|nr:hypothetical protein [Ideonella azotifigens]MCD2338759.1 hypothetical protein [Ideonella azotifigens]
MDLRAAPARRRAVAGLVVLAVHGVLVCLGWQTKLELPRERETPVVSWMRLLPDPVARVLKEAERSVAPAPPVSRSLVVAAPAAPSPGAAAAVVPTPNVPINEASTASPPAALPGHVGLDGAEVGVPAPAARAASGALVLAPRREVLRESFANPGVLDPRSNTPVPTFEEHIALGMNPDLCLKVERLPDGSTRRALVHRVDMPSAMQAMNGIRTAPVRTCP